MEARSWALEMLVIAGSGVGGLRVAGQVGNGGVDASRRAVSLSP